MAGFHQIARPFGGRLHDRAAGRGGRASRRASLAVIGGSSLLLWALILAAIRLFVS